MQNHATARYRLKIRPLGGQPLRIMIAIGLILQSRLLAVNKRINLSIIYPAFKEVHGRLIYRKLRDQRVAMSLIVHS